MLPLRYHCPAFAAGRLGADCVLAIPRSCHTSPLAHSLQHRRILGHAELLDTRCSRSVVRHSLQPDKAPQPQTDKEDGLLNRAWRKFNTFTFPQKIYSLVLGAVAAYVIPQLLWLSFIPAERVLVGALLAAEEAIVVLLFKWALLVVVAALIGLFGWGLYVFVVKKREA